MKTVKQEEPISRSRFADCPVCKNRNLKLKQTVQVGRCKSCNETYKIITVYVKTGKKAKPVTVTSGAQSENKAKSRSENVLSSWEQLPSDNSLFGTSSHHYSGLSKAVFGDNPSESSSEAGSGSGP